MIKLIIFFICAITITLVFSLMLIALLKHRKKHHKQTKPFHKYLTTEIAWMLIPFILLIGMALPATLVFIENFDETISHLFS